MSLRRTDTSRRAASSADQAPSHTPGALPPRAAAERVTRSASRAASGTDDASRCLLLALSHDELGVIVDGLADPLQPVVAVALSSTCLGLRTPLQAALEVLKERHARVPALCRKVQMSRATSAQSTSSFEGETASSFAWRSCAELRDAKEVYWRDMARGLDADDMVTLGMLLSKWLPRLQRLYLDNNVIGDAGMQALCEPLGWGVAPALWLLGVNKNNIGPAGAEALAAALGRGAMPNLEALAASHNPIGHQGVAALAAPLRKLPALKELRLYNCGIRDEGVGSLFANLGKDDFKALKELDLSRNRLGDAAMTTLLAGLEAGRLPMLCNEHVMMTSGLPLLLENVRLDENPASAPLSAVTTAVKCALLHRHVQSRTSTTHPDLFR